MLDILLQGRRLHLGIGRGIAPHEYASLGYLIEQSYKYFYDGSTPSRPPTAPSDSSSKARSTTYRPRPSGPRPGTRES